MKIKNFKQEVKTEQFDIPNVLEKIKPAAYSRKIPLIEPVKPAFKWKPIIATFAAIVVVTVIFFSFPNNYKENELADPSDDNTESPESPTNEYSEAEADDIKGITRESYYGWLFDQAVGSDAEATFNSHLTEEQRDTYVSSDVYFAFYNIVVNLNTKDFDRALEQLILWGSKNDYAEEYFNNHENELIYIFNNLTN